MKPVEAYKVVHKRLLILFGFYFYFLEMVAKRKWKRFYVRRIIIALLFSYDVNINLSSMQ